MERFVKINKQVKTNLFKICRLCGIDNPNKIGILEEVVFLSDDGEIEPPLYKKIFNCVGIQVTPDDKMPKTVCALCFDKINDFHEFREMCYVTNVQTRKLLGLSEQPKIELKWEQNVAVINPLASQRENSEMKKNKIDKKPKKRKNAEPPPENGAKQVKIESSADPIKSEIKIEDEIVLNKSNKKIKPKLDKGKNDKNLPKSKNIKQEPKPFMCNICHTAFFSAALLQSHLLKTHVPLIDRYYCFKCNERINENTEIKSHNLWHKLSKTPYKCLRCDKEIQSLQGLTRHVREVHYVPRKAVLNILPNVVCKFCSVEFQTKNLFFMHHCITNSLQCPKCKCKLSTQANTLKHIATCSAKIRNEDEMGYVIKTEPAETPSSISLTPVDTNSAPILPSPSLSKLKVSKNSNEQLSPAPICKENRNSRSSHNMVVIPSSSTVQPPDSDVAGKQQKEDAMMARCSVLLQDTLRTLVNIKQEPIDTPNAQIILEKNQNEINEIEIPIENMPTPHIKQEILDESYKEIESNLEINIKQEVISYPTISQPPLPALKLKIKKEHGTLNSSFIDNSDNEASYLESHKKKKAKNSKKKNKESEKSNIADELKSPSTEESEKETNDKIDFPQPVTIKAERIDPDYENNENNDMAGDVDDFQNYDDYNSDHENDQEISDNLNALPVISSIQSGSESVKLTSEENLNKNESNTNKSPSLSLQISSITSGLDIFDQLRKNDETIIDSNIEISENVKEIEKTKEAESSIPQDGSSINCAMPQIVAVSSGVNISSDSILTVNNEDSTKQQDALLPQISQVSSNVHLENTITDSQNKFEFSNVIIKEEPDFGGYYDPIVLNYEKEDNVDNINESENIEDHDKLEENDSYENSENEGLHDKYNDRNVKENKVNKRSSNKEKSNLNKVKQNNYKKATRKLKENDLEQLNNQAGETDQQCNDFPEMEEDESNEEENIETIEYPISQTENIFDPNIKIKQEIEVAEEILVEDDQYEYESENDDNNSYENDYNDSQFNKCTRSPSPIRELQPIIMNVVPKTEPLSDTTNFDNFMNSDTLNENCQTLNNCELNNPVSENKDIDNEDDMINWANKRSHNSCHNDDSEIENFGFKKIKLNIPIAQKLEISLTTNQKSKQEKLQPENLYQQHEPVLGLMISSVAHFAESNTVEAENTNITNPEDITGNLENSETVSNLVNLHNSSDETENLGELAVLSNESNEQFTIRLPKLENINEIAENHNNENFEKMLRNEIGENESNYTEEQNEANAPIITQVTSFNSQNMDLAEEIENANNNLNGSNNEQLENQGIDDKTP